MTLVNSGIKFKSLALPIKKLAKVFKAIHKTIHETPYSFRVRENYEMSCEILLFLHAHGHYKHEKRFQNDT